MSLLCVRNIELRDRGKDIIISGRENISSIEVEQQSPPIPPPPQEIIAFCRERLAHCKCPDAIEFGPLSKTSTRKIQKFVAPRARMVRPRQRISST